MISFFSQRRGSGTIRGSQVAERLGSTIARLNPTSDYENDICIFVKREPFIPFPKRSYLDVIDNVEFVRWLKEHPEMGAIAFTKPSQQNMEKNLNRNDIVYIPQHHCNFERYVRPNRPIKVVGCCGSKFVLGHDTEDATKMFKKIGLELRYLIYPTYRRSVIRWYCGIDIHICYRAYMKYYNFKDSLKVVNAGSYGIPTVAFPEPNNELEFKDCYVPVTSFEELVEECQKLKNDEDYYNKISSRVLPKSEEYHIDNILKYYCALEENE